MQTKHLGIYSNSSNEQQRIYPTNKPTTCLPMPYLYMSPGHPLDFFSYHIRKVHTLTRSLANFLGSSNNPWFTYLLSQVHYTALVSDLLLEFSLLDKQNKLERQQTICFDTQFPDHFATNALLSGNRKWELSMPSGYTIPPDPDNVSPWNRAYQ